MKVHLDKLIRKLYLRKPIEGFTLPAYFTVGRFRLCIYAMDMDWESLRVKIERDGEVWLVIKKGTW